MLLMNVWMQLKAGFEEDKDIVVSVMSAMGEEKIVALNEVDIWKLDILLTVIRYSLAFLFLQKHI